VAWFQRRNSNHGLGTVSQGLGVVSYGTWKANSRIHRQGILARIARTNRPGRGSISDRMITTMVIIIKEMGKIVCNTRRSSLIPCCHGLVQQVWDPQPPP
jgi:hypothetical protein